MKKAIRYFGMPVVFLTLFSCAQVTQETPVEPRLRAVVESAASGTVRLTAYLEGQDGNALTGAIVTAQNAAQVTQLLVLDTETYSYTGTMEEAVGETTYTFEAATILSSSPLVCVVPYRALSEKPVVSIFRDATGNSVLSGQVLSAFDPCQIAWVSCGENVVYQVNVKTALRTVYATSTKACTVTLSGSALPAGQYILEINAQQLYGDPLYKSVAYYSVSNAKSAGMSFYVN